MHGLSPNSSSNGRIDDPFEVILAAYLLVPEIEEGMIEKALVEQARRVAFLSALVHEADLKGSGRVFGLDDGVGGDVGVQIGISLLECAQKRDLVVLVLCDHRKPLRFNCRCGRVL